MDTNTEKHIIYLLRLFSSVINRAEPQEPDFDIDWEVIYSAAKNHNIEGAVFYAVEKLGNKPEPALLKKWTDNRSKCFHRYLIQSGELEKLRGLFSENKIEFMFLKGLRVGALYPSPEYRYMSDIDVLIKGDRAPAADILLKLGYTESDTSFDYDLSYTLPPFMNVELHNNLLPQNSPFRGYFDDIFSRSVKRGFEYEMTAEDFYLFNIIHLYKHFFAGGTGIRSVADLYLINKRVLPTLDPGLVSSRLEETGLTEFARSMSDIADKWFGGEELSDLSEEELYIISSGTFGNVEHHIMNGIKSRGKGRYILDWIFPSKEYMYELNKGLNKRRFLLPFYYITRLFRGLFTKRSKIQQELEMIKRTNTNK